MEWVGQEGLVVVTKKNRVCSLPSGLPRPLSGPSVRHSSLRTGRASCSARGSLSAQAQRLQWLPSSICFQPTAAASHPRLAGSGAAQGLSENSSPGAADPSPQSRQPPGRGTRSRASQRPQPQLRVQTAGGVCQLPSYPDALPWGLVLIPTSLSI